MKKLICSLLITLSVGGVSGWITTDKIFPWYTNLNKPSFTPPDWLFSPVWTILYILMGIALYKVWKQPLSERRNAALFIFLIQLMFNFLWSILFFQFHQIGWAVVDIVALWLCVLITIFSFARVSRAAAWLMIPYIVWVSFATLLNISIWRLNN